jgi:hypothetical protein
MLEAITAARKKWSDTANPEQQTSSLLKNPLATEGA